MNSSENRRSYLQTEIKSEEDGFPANVKHLEVFQSAHVNI